MTPSAPTPPRSAALPPLSITGGGGNDTLDLSAITTPATVEMPIAGTPLPTTGTCTGAPPSTIGAVCASGSAPAITFTGIPNLVGTAAGGDYFFAGSGTESMTEIGSPGTLDYSALPVPANPANNVQGIIADATDLSGTPGGTVTSPTTIGVTDTFTQIGTFNGTRDNDTFMQCGPGSYTFNGGAGANTLDLSNAPGRHGGVAEAAERRVHHRHKEQQRNRHRQRRQRQLHLHGVGRLLLVGRPGAPRPDGHGQRRWRRHARPGR